MTDDPAKIKKQRSTILQLYVLFIGALIAGFLPYTIPQLFGFIILILLVIAIPFYQLRLEKGAFFHSHLQYLNRTIWIGSFFLLISILALGYWVYVQSDQSAFEDLFARINQGIMVGESEILSTLENYMHTNMPLLLKASLMCLGPSLIYIFYRSLKAVRCAYKSVRMAKPKSWL